MSDASEQHERIDDDELNADASGDAPEGDAEDREAAEVIADLQKKHDELFDRLQRTAADYHNYMKRSERTRLEDRARDRADVLRAFIPVVDTIDQALSAHKPEHDEAKKVLEGVRIVRDELLKVLTSQGVTRIEPRVGEAFDPHLHEAMLQQPAEGVKPNHITLALSPGYLYNDRALRPAKVAVAPG